MFPWSTLCILFLFLFCSVLFCSVLLAFDFVSLNQTNKLNFFSDLHPADQRDRLRQLWIIQSFLVGVSPLTKRKGLSMMT